jgi:5'-nucleotidase (lipoprotein e(P4) family)
VIARVALAACAVALPLSGCVAAAVPIAAGAGIFKAQQDRKPKRERRKAARAEAPKPGEAFTAPDGSKVTVVGYGQLPPPTGAPAAMAAAKVPPEMQYLYGSGEAAALSLQAYQAMWNYLHNDLRFRRQKTSVVLSPGSTLANPKFEPCGDRPLAVVLDIDETVLLNLGYEGDVAVRGGPYDAARWTRWEESGADKVAAVPGAAETLAQVRRDGITVIFNSNRGAGTAAQTAKALEGAGLGPAAFGDTLWLRGAGEDGGKDIRRARIAQRYCIVALAGDQLGDFSDLFNAADLGTRARRNSAGETMVSQLWGNGWFMLPNPVYGTGLKGNLDDVFPPETRWTDPQEKK